MASSSPLYRSEYEPRAFRTTSPSNDRYWSGFATGALIGTAAAVAGYLISSAFRGSRDTRIVRFETSLQIGRPVNEVFRAWADFEQLPKYIDMVEQVHAGGRTSHWKVRVDGRHFEWQAETVQFIPNEAIGWKSISGPKHTGRVNFAPINHDTLMHVSINYAPPLGRFGGLLSPATEHIEGYIQEALRDFKAALEAKGSTLGRSTPQRAEWRQDERQRVTGTYGGSTGPVGNAEDTTEKRPGTVEYTRPPEARYPISNPRTSGDK